VAFRDELARLTALLASALERDFLVLRQRARVLGG